MHDNILAIPYYDFSTILVMAFVKHDSFIHVNLTVLNNSLAYNTM